MKNPKRYTAVEFCRGAWHIEGPNGIIYDEEPRGNEKKTVWRDEDEVLEVVKRWNISLEELENQCPRCKEGLVHVNPGDGTVDTYCEECGWPGEGFDAKKSP